MNSPEMAALINEAHPKLKAYVHDLETSRGNEAHIVQDNFAMREQLSAANTLIASLQIDKAVLKAQLAKVEQLFRKVVDQTPK